MVAITSRFEMLRQWDQSRRVAGACCLSASRTFDSLEAGNGNKPQLPFFVRSMAVVKDPNGSEGNGAPELVVNVGFSNVSFGTDKCMCNIYPPASGIPDGRGHPYATLSMCAARLSRSTRRCPLHEPLLVYGASETSTSKVTRRVLPTHAKFVVQEFDDCVHNGRFPYCPVGPRLFLSCQHPDEKRGRPGYGHVMATRGGSCGGTVVVCKSADCHSSLRSVC